MSNLAKILLTILLLAALAVPVWSQAPQPPPSPMQLSPQWVPVPGVQGVQYAPNSGMDFFHYGQGYYSFHQGVWFRTPSLQGPWVQIPQPPQVFHQIQAPYFKNPPGWARGKKTGWGGAPMPPGQMKKYEEGSRIPPGQIKKMH